MAKKEEVKAVAKAAPKVREFCNKIWSVENYNIEKSF